MRVLVIAGLAVLTGCATSSDYVSYLAAHKAAHDAKASSERARFAAIAEIAKNSQDPSARTAAVMALAMGKSDTPIAPPAPPEDPVFKWASLVVPTVSNLGSGYFGYRIGVTQSNNNKDTTIASHNAFASVATGGFNAIQGTAAAGFNSNSTLGSFIQAPMVPQANVTLSGAGVIGSGSYSYSAPVTTTTTTTTNSNNTSRNCQGGSGAAGGAGGGTTTGAAGGNGAAGGGATC